MEEVENTIRDLESKTDYMEKFYANYLKSDYAPYFAGHENGILYRWERVIRLKHQVEEDEADLPMRSDYDIREKVILSTPEESWNYFIDHKLSFLKERGIVGEK